MLYPYNCIHGLKGGGLYISQKSRKARCCDKFSMTRKSAFVILRSIATKNLGLCKALPKGYWPVDGKPAIIVISYFIILSYILPAKAPTDDPLKR